MTQYAKTIVASPLFEKLIIGLIVLTAVLIGAEAFPEWVSPTAVRYLDGLHSVILFIFILEMAVKLIALWPQPLRYFYSGWNVFDFSLIVLSLLPFTGQLALVGRLLRLLRVLRLISALPELRLLSETLMRSIPSMGSVLLLMGLLFFIYAVIGYHLFHVHDPLHWRNLAYAVLSLFRIMTLEDWTDIMYTAMELSPFYGIYFVSFVLIATFIVINLFIAVVLNNFDSVKAEVERRNEKGKEKADDNAGNEELRKACEELRAGLARVERQLEDQANRPR